MARKTILWLSVLIIIIISILYSYNTLWKTPSLKEYSLMSAIKQVDIEAYIANIAEAEPEDTVLAYRSLDLINGFIEKYNNEDIIGYVKIDNTNIDYPVVHYTDNEFYLNHNYNKEKSVEASIFMDYEDNLKRDNYNTILYGHNMKNKTMFGDLVKYKNKDFFKYNKYIQFDTLLKSGTWEIFSCYIVPDGTDSSYLQVNFISEEAFAKFITKLKENSMYETDVDVQKGDRILTLSTCSYETDNARFVVHAKLIKE